MRDAFGSTFMFRLIIIFIVFYVSFMTIAVCYAKVFRIKNGIIDILEQNQYNYVNNTSVQNIVYGKVDAYLSSFAYDYSGNQDIQKLCKQDDGKLSNNGACIIPIKSGENVYYRVKVYLVITFPVFSRNFIIPVSGDTETIAFD